MRHLCWLFLSVMLWIPQARAEERCYGTCLSKAKDLLLDPAGQPPVEVLRRVQELAARECAEEDKEACTLAARLKETLAEYAAVSREKGDQAASQVLSARQCIFALTQETDADFWATGVTSWCSPALDACDHGLMVIIGHAEPPTRSELVTAICSEKVCTPANPKLAACSQKEPVGAKTAVALLRVALATGLPAPVAKALGDAFEKPRYPFFGGAAAKKPQPRAK